MGLQKHRAPFGYVGAHVPSLGWILRLQDPTETAVLGLLLLHGLLHGSCCTVSLPITHIYTQAHLSGPLYT